MLIIYFQIKMVKSRAEICRDYIKRLNEGYLRKERECRQNSHVSSHLLKPRETTMYLVICETKGNNYVSSHFFKPRERTRECERTVQQRKDVANGKKSVLHSKPMTVVHVQWKKLTPVGMKASECQHLGMVFSLKRNFQGVPRDRI